MMPRPVDAATAELAGVQGGVVSRGQLAALGLSADGVLRRRKAGRLHSVHPTVYAVGHAVLGRTGREWAAVLATDGVLSHRSAGARLGVLTWNGRCEVTARRGHQPIPGVTVHTSRHVHPDDITLDAEDGLPYTTWARTTVDLADIYDLHQMTRYLERSAIERRYDGLTLAPAMERARGRHGLPTLVAALNTGHHLNAQRTRSPLEERYLTMLREQGEDEAHFNHWMQVGDTWIEADVWFPKRRLIVELDSRWHDTVGARRRDAARDRA
ncbi:MAG: hypothetical protein ACXVFK_17765, partial [Solirubrobacteraceae bacterium]